MTPENPVAGWYPDPQDAAMLRWWDGAQWSAQTQPLPTEPPQTPPWQAEPGQPYPPPVYAPRESVPQLGGLRFGAWIWIGLAIGVLLPLAVFFSGFSGGFDSFSAALLVLGAVLVAGIVLMFFPRLRGLGTGLLISVAATPIVTFGVCVVMLSASGFV
ncbi:DUF2510 domain-containing protein [Microbacterium sp. NPDC096154]|uniref:DUF2510 domain-containing protein n=1 Tax=Microbacterium sp. NPDC096154 TaxID=3155549 RepID=UPI003322559F